MIFEEFKFAAIPSNYAECVSQKLLMMFTRDVCLLQDRWYLKRSVVWWVFIHTRVSIL